MKKYNLPRWQSCKAGVCGQDNCQFENGLKLIIAFNMNNIKTATNNSMYSACVYNLK